jgi:3-oxo-5alpha-steroid 4-dehydrogenase
MAEDYGEGIWQGIVEVSMQPLVRTSYLIIDSAIYALITPAPAASSIVAQANTVHDLAVALNTAPGVLEDTINFYNTDAANHSDPVFNKLSKYVVPIATPPFYALSQPPGSCFTMGGLRINTSAQVLDTTGAPIPGLYAAGRNSSSVLAQGYQGSGNSVGSGLTFGRIAGQNAAAETPWTT